MPPVKSIPTKWTCDMVVRADKSTNRSDELRFHELERGACLSDQVAEGALGAIIPQGLRPGDPLPSERELAGQNGVSRTVIREAVRSLAGQGIVNTEPVDVDRLRGFPWASPGEPQPGDAPVRTSRGGLR